jgi:hypothetical protein|tara:strand:+ start:814 stop:1104 length:291 start_codon:yes stop_codon:yes gene_type:complete
MSLPEISYDEWFHKPHPHDSMPIATDNPRPEEEIADAYQSRHESSPEFEKTAEEVVTMHEKMYRMATARYNPFHIGASENYHADIDYVGGSEEAHK